SLVAGRTRASCGALSSQGCVQGEHCDRSKSSDSVFSPFITFLLQVVRCAPGSLLLVVHRCRRSSGTYASALCVLSIEHDRARQRLPAYQVTSAFIHLPQATSHIPN